MMKINNVIKIWFLLFLASCVTGQKDGVAPSSGGGGTAALDPTCPSSSCKMYITSGTYDGSSIGGISGADTICNSDSNKPAGTGNYKAFLMKSGVRDLSNDWIFYASHTYVRSDGSTVIGTTNAQKTFTFPLTASISGSNTPFMSSLDLASGSWVVASQNCSGWTTGSAGSSYGYGLGGLTDNHSFSSILSGSTGTFNCSQLKSMLCIQF